MTEEDKKVIQKVEDAYRASKEDTLRQFKEEVWLLSYNAWRSRLKTVIPRKSNLFIPVTYQTVETMIAREMSAIFNDTGRLYEFQARKKDQVDAATTLTEFINFDFNRIPNVYKKFRKERLHNHIYGTSFFRVYWDYQWVLDEHGKINTLKDQFNIDNVSPRNFFPDPVAKSLDDCRYVITRSLVDQNDFKEMIKRLEYSRLTEKEIKQISVQGGIGFEEDFNELAHRDSLALDKNRQFIEVIEYWSKPDDEYIAIGGGKFIIRNSKIPFAHKRYPFVMDLDIPEPEEFWGISTVELIHDLQAELNAIRNRRMDKWNFTTNPMWKAKQSSIFDTKELVSRPGGIVRLKDMSDLEKLDMGDTSQSDYVEEQNCKTDIQNASSISDFAQGFDMGTRNDTATGISIISSNADAKIITKIQYMQEEFLKPLGFFWISLQQQFGKSEEIFLVTGKEWRFLKNMLFYPYELKVLASTQIINKTIRQNQLMQLSQLAMASPEVNRTEWLKVVFDAYGLNSSKLLIQPLPQLPTGIPPNVQGGGQPDVNAGMANAPIGEPRGRDFVKGEPV